MANVWEERAITLVDQSFWGCDAARQKTQEFPRSLLFLSPMYSMRQGVHK